VSVQAIKIINAVGDQIASQSIQCREPKIDRLVVVGLLRPRVIVDIASLACPWRALDAAAPAVSLVVVVFAPGLVHTAWLFSVVEVLRVESGSNFE